MIEYIWKSMSDAVNGAAMLLYSLGTGTSLEHLTRNAYQVF
jgi:hypothetical protein